MNPDEVNPKSIKALGSQVEMVIDKITKYADRSGDRELLLLVIELSQLQIEYYEACSIFLYKLEHRPS